VTEGWGAEYDVVGCELWRLEEGKCCVGCACVDSMGGRERLIGGLGDRLPEVLMLVDVDEIHMYPSRMYLGYAPPHIRYGTYISIAPLSPSNPEFFTALLFSRYSDGIGGTAAHISCPGGDACHPPAARHLPVNLFAAKWWLACV
jgi:hypothetical protein